MATSSLKRTLNLAPNLRSLLRPTRRLSNLPRFPFRSTSATPPERLGFRPNPWTNSRGFAKGRKSRDGNDGDVVQDVADIGPSVKEAAVSQMEAAKDALMRELSKLRTGRASAGMLDHIIVEMHGAKLPLNRVSVVSVIDAKTLSVTPYDQNGLKSLHTAIVSSPLGLNPTDDGQRLIAVIPPLTKENIQALCKVVNKHSEDVKQSIRRARQKALDSIKKAGSSIPKDSAKRLMKSQKSL